MVNVANNNYISSLVYLYPIEIIITIFELLVNLMKKYATSGAKDHGTHTFSPADMSLGVCMPKPNSEMTILLTVTKYICRGTQLICYRKGKEGELSLQEW